MKQWIEDFWLQLKSSRAYQAGAIGAILFLAFTIFYKPKQAGPKPDMRAQRAPLSTSVGGSSQSEVAKDILTAFNEQLQGMKTQQVEIMKRIDDKTHEDKENESRMVEILKRMNQRITELDTQGPAGSGATSVTNVSTSGDAATSDPGAQDGMGSFSAPQMEKIEGAAPAPVPLAPPDLNKVAVVGAGDHVRVKLIGAVQAPTDGTPYPVLFKVMSNIAGPNSSSLPIGEATIVAAAQGSLTNSRALFRLSSLNLAMPNGQRTVMDVDGWVVGEDGLAGLEGRLIDPIGQAISGAGMAAGVGALGTALSVKNVSQQTGLLGNTSLTLTGSEGQYAAGQAVSSAADVWGRIIEQRVKLLVPHVEVLSGREATAVFSKSFTIQGLIEAYQNDEDSYQSAD